MVNNGGDIGKTLAQLGSDESVKNLLLTMATAGALDQLNTSMDWQGINAQSPFAPQLGKNLSNNLARDMVGRAIAGKPFDESSLALSLQSAVITTGMAQGAHAIGEARVDERLSVFSHKVAHAMLGCMGAAAPSGGGCAAGAVGAAVGEMAASYRTEQLTQNEPGAS